MHRLPIFALAALVLPLAACGVTVGAECEIASETELDDAEVTSFGFSVDEVLAVVVGEHATGGTVANVGAADLVVGVARGEGPGRFVRNELVSLRVPNGELFGESHLMNMVTCDDYVTVPVELGVDSDDLTVFFHEAADATVSDGGPAAVAIRAELDAAGVEGLPPPEQDHVREAFASVNFAHPDATEEAMLGGEVGWSGDLPNGVWAERIVEWDAPLPRDAPDAR